MVRVISNTLLSRIAIILFSLVFISTTTEGYQSNLTHYTKTQSYNTSNLYDFNRFISNFSEPTEEEAKLDSLHQNHIHSSLSSYIPQTIVISSEFLSFHLLEPVSYEILKKQKNRAPPKISI
ncbi:hypothetical protein EHQ24_10890 [Leptospira noumeaensis]|uniref:Uncharacterized protein n=1 Tax=Leptospira noumeaensis TaxID=2484964 RepID=A0A4V3JJS9_9LEPT|nr:hypothetical protein [Leptospira noumeaensis]TGK81794.1 hypothetical protein EHQ24_10890 [Leptospira noumeaensis]